MKIVRYPQRSQWAEIVKRPVMDAAELSSSVRSILADVKSAGDDAVRRYEEMFDHAHLATLEVSDEELAEAELFVDDSLKEALKLAHDNIAKFHEAQLQSIKKITTSPGVTCWQKSVAIEKVGLYIPGGTAPLFSTVLMLAVPAKIAGCSEVVLCSPPGRDGKLNPAILYAAKLSGVRKIFKIGGVQAIGAMAYGTESVPKVYKIFGPGNQYVTAAKQQVSLSDVAIDMPAGPSEVCVIADETSNAVFVAADLLSQTEHGIDSQAVLICSSEAMTADVLSQIKTQIVALPRHDIAEKALQNSLAIIVSDNDTAVQLSNVYAPEHLIIATEDSDVLADKVVNAGSVFLGKYACESAGDYASGTNHTLPTHGHATAYNGVNLDSYMRKITFQRLSAEGIASIGHAVETMAAGERLDAHKNAMTLRLKYINATPHTQDK